MPQQKVASNSVNSAAVPPSSPLREILVDHQHDIERWFDRQWQKTPPPFYSSVDLRNAGFKLAPIDTNLFPAGFNNLNLTFSPLAEQAIRATIAEICPNVTRLLLIPESHSRNTFYFESLASLLEILKQAGLSVRIASLDPDITGAITITLPSQRQITLERLERTGNRIGVSNFEPDHVILNNDLSNGVPNILQQLEQPITPSPQLGWSNRLKSAHFACYQHVCNEFSVMLDCDPWLFNPLFDKCPEVNFMTQEGQHCLYTRAQQLLHKIKYKYEQYGINHKPFLVVKADAGTYGMAVTMIRDPEELLMFNRKQRTRMSTIKGGKPVTKAIIQEGVHSLDTVGVEKAAAEPVIYAIGREIIGSFYRVHQQKAADENLNAPGMTFAPLPLSDTFCPYRVVAKLAILAAARETAALDKARQDQE